ncbi:major facilitator superfamily domain-containing protein [Boeremia exigua]|uniref:major facilitator superfamily domain-containing protein n=1 Tax=Boeremia exigua TaxID=749465 RepID=UPI001E8D06C6|nr:major facilitator superfamily domain-containing protein [Boeremia exigua]KAH6615236.1 major facilitator superfamily domain-containing protein [Boeremia exigua]
MAIWLYRQARGAIREHQAKKIVPTTESSHLVPETISSHQQHSSENGIALNSPRASQSITEHTKESAQEKADARRRNIIQWKLLLGLVLPNFLAAVDVTIVAPAIPLISSDFNRLSGSFNWIVAAYTLTFTTFVPVTGQFAEAFGRHSTLHFQMFWIMIGSALCAGAQTWGMLLVGRALQGLGAAGIMNLSRIILADNGATLAQIARNNSTLSLISGVSYGIGPVVGGYLADASWRYCFVLPVGLAVLSHILIVVLMRKELVKGHAARQAGNNGASRRTNYIAGFFSIDWLGVFLFISGVGLIVLAVQWGGTQYAWNSAASIAPFVIGGVLVVAFFVHEYLMGPGRFTARLLPRQVPMIPSTLFRKKDTSLLMIINFSAGISLVSAFYFISYYWQLAEGYTPSKAGVQLLYYTPGLGVGVYAAMYMCNVRPAQTFIPLFIGSIVEAVGLAVLTYAVSIRHGTLVNVFLAIAGAGTGLRFMPVVLHAAGTWSTRGPAMQSLLSFTLPLGETIGISIMGAVFTNKLSHYSSGIPGYNGARDLATLQDLSGPVREAVHNAAARSVMWALISVLPFVGLSVIASIFLGNVWIGKVEQEAKKGQPQQKATRGYVMYGVYLFALFRGTVASSKQELDVNIEDEETRQKVPDMESYTMAAPRTVHIKQDRI